MAVERSWALACKRVGRMDGRRSRWRHKTRLEKELDDFVHDCRVSLETQTLAEQSDSCKSEARLAPNFAYSSDGVDDAVDTRGVEDSAALTCPRPVQSQSRGCVEGASG